jgi:SNF2 family DNA or RNA helicase
MRAYADLGHGRIVVRTQATGDWEDMVAASKRVRGGRFRRDPEPHWHYPLSTDTCRALRHVFGDALRVSTALAAWYTEYHQAAQAHERLSASNDAALPYLSHSHPSFASWLRPSQRVGAAWVAQGYRNAGLVADTPGVGKTAETISGIIESRIGGPILVVCPKASVRPVWGQELSRHLPEVPAYLCDGTRAQRHAELKRFANDIHRDPHTLRFVVVVAEMLRVVLGDPCWTVKEVIGEDGIRRENVPSKRISGMCPQRMKNMNMECTLHVQVPVQKEKEKVVVDFSYPALFDQYLLGGGWSQIVVDESHKLLGSLTIAQGNLMGRGLKLLPERTGRRFALSGTPFGKAGRVTGLFGTLHWLWPDEYTSYWKWVDEKFEVTVEVVNRQGREVRKIGGLKGVSASASPDQESAAWERFVAELGPRILRRTKEEAFADLPAKQYAEVVCAMVPDQERQYRTLMLDAEVPTPGGVVMVNGSLALLTRARQIANGQITRRPDSDKVAFTGEHSGKIDALWQALDERGILAGTPGTKIVVASQFNEFLDALGTRLSTEGVAFLTYDGRMSVTERDRVITAWQATTVDHCRVLLLNSFAGGLSITLDAADEMHIMDEMADPGANEQLEDRIHRASRIHHVLIAYYRSPGTIEHRRAHDVEYRRRLQQALLDGRRGIEDTRIVLRDAFREDRGE